MALSFNLNLSSQTGTSSNSSRSESAGSLASNNTESAGSLAYVSQSGGLSGSQVDEFVSSNPFAPTVDYSVYDSSDSVACGSESAGSIASSDFGSDSGSSGCDFSSFC